MRPRERSEQSWSIFQRWKFIWVRHEPSAEPFKPCYTRVRSVATKAQRPQATNGSAAYDAGTDFLVLTDTVKKNWALNENFILMIAQEQHSCKEDQNIQEDFL